jgi:hypothetical protein
MLKILYHKFVSEKRACYLDDRLLIETGSFNFDCGTALLSGIAGSFASGPISPRRGQGATISRHPGASSTGAGTGASTGASATCRSDRSPAAGTVGPCSSTGLLGPWFPPQRLAFVLVAQPAPIQAFPLPRLLKKPLESSGFRRPAKVPVAPVNRPTAGPAARCGPRLLRAAAHHEAAQAAQLVQLPPFQDAVLLGYGRIVAQPAQVPRITWHCDLQCTVLE